MTKISRTSIQIEADAIDLEMHRLSSRLESFAKVLRCPHVDEVSRRLFQGRGVVRKHMHRVDRENTD